jgi:hypothetical protein
MLVVLAEFLLSLNVYVIVALKRLISNHLGESKCLFLNLGKFRALIWPEGPFLFSCLTVANKWPNLFSSESSSQAGGGPGIRLLRREYESAVQ